MHDFASFEQALTSYVRETEGEKVDERPKMAEAFKFLSVEDLAEMDHGDIAAAFSGIINVKSALALPLEGVKGKALMEAVKALKDKNQLPLSTTDAGCQQLLDGCLVEKKGLVLYRNVAVLLAKAKTDKRFAELLVGGNAADAGEDYSDSAASDSDEDDSDTDLAPPGYPMQD